MVIGGNKDGIFAFAVDGYSPEEKGGLLAGDQILKVNGIRIHGMTRDEAIQTLHVSGQVKLVVRRAPELCKQVSERGGSGDSFHIRTQFAYDGLKKGEMSFREGELFHVSNTVPNGAPGFWTARRLPIVEKKPSTEDQMMDGLIPNRLKADQLATKLRLSQAKPSSEQKGGVFRFKRAKSADRSKNLRGGDEDNETETVLSGYERVSPSREPTRKPVVVIGLFCDTVINMLVRDSPDIFEAPGEGVELKGGHDPPVNIDLINEPKRRGKHALIVLSPPSIEYVQQKTDLNPIVLYIAPVSKTVIKAVKTKLAPNYNKAAGYMYEEAIKFERSYAPLFTATVDYTPDDWWFFNLKVSIFFNYLIVMSDV